MRHPDKRSRAERDALVEQWLGLPTFVAKRLDNLLKARHFDREDAKQIGMIALIRSAELYDESHGYKFVTYATNAIYNTMMREVLRTCDIVRVKYNNHRTKNPRIIEAVKQARKRVKSLISNYSSDKNSWHPMIRDPEWPDEWPLDQCIGELDERMQTIIALRYFKGLTLEETGKELSLTKERVRQIQNKALETLRRFMSRHSSMARERLSRIEL